MIVHPTHSCFDDALDLLVELVQTCPDLRPKMKLVHGICTTPDGHHYAHAWVEDTEKDICCFAGIQDCERRLFATKTEEYRKEVGVVESTSYLLQEAALGNLLCGHYGPWIEKYRKLCADKFDDQELPAAPAACDRAGPTPDGVHRRQ